MLGPRTCETVDHRLMELRISAEFVYDELSFFAENCAEHGLVLGSPPLVQRRVHRDPAVDAPTMSSLRWGAEAPRSCCCTAAPRTATHGDTTLLALGRPASAIDLPGHGRSGPPRGRALRPSDEVRASIAAVIEAEVRRPDPAGRHVLGGLTANAVAASRPDSSSDGDHRHHPRGQRRQARQVHDFIAGPQTFATFEEILARTIEFNPRGRSPRSPGILHTRIAPTTAAGSGTTTADS